MAVTSVQLNSLELISADYAISSETIAAMVSGPARTPVAHDMAGRYPAFVRSQLEARPIPIIVFMLAGTYAGRKSDYETLASATGGGALVTLQWTSDAVTKSFQVHCSGAVTDEWYHRVTISAIAFDPVAV